MQSYLAVVIMTMLIQKKISSILNANQKMQDVTKNILMTKYF
uniref:Uncharacterized protein n=1 Tax=Yersinia enterocolitica W22703 TaxID=913028 RepID=F4MV61_YEREN|nr:unknown protein [Yersinia enterocolitica W22703]